MQFCLAVFKSRNETLYLANLLMSKGYRVGVVNTPQKVGLACGISVQFSESLLQIVGSVIKSKPFRSFYGFFKVKKEGEKMVVIKL